MYAMLPDPIPENYTPFTLEVQNRSDRSRTVLGCSVNATVFTRTVFAWNGSGKRSRTVENRFRG